MNAFALKSLTLTTLLILALPSARADEEQDLIQRLASNAPAPAKADACHRLRLIGTPRAVPALAALLSEDRLSHAARHALEALPYPEAGRALRQALPLTAGRLQAGILDSLGWRRDAEAVPLLKPLLAHPDPEIAAAAAAALGRIASPEALAALNAARTQASPDLRPAVIDALLVAADRHLALGRHDEADALARSLEAPGESDALRIAAVTLRIRAAAVADQASQPPGTRARDLVLAALRGTDAAAQSAALKAAADLPGPDLPRALANLLPEAPAALQIPLLAFVHQRGDPVALPAVLAAARHTDPAIRAAALTALGTVGDATALPLLAAGMASPDSLEQAAAREALTVIHRGKVTAALVDALPHALPALQRELFRALAVRADPAAVPPLLALARSDVDSLRLGALQTLGVLADRTDVGALVDLLTQTPDPAAREDLRGVFETLVERFSEPGSLPAEPIVEALASGHPQTRAALLPVAALMVHPHLPAAFRTALRDPDPAVRAAAQRAMCTSRDPALLPDLLEVARRTTDASLRTLALEGAVRLATETGPAVTVPQRAETLATAFAIASAGRPEDRRAVLSGLSQVPHATCLQLASQARTDPDPALRAQAEFAVLQIARGLAPTQLDLAETSLRQLAAGTVNPSVQTNAQALLQSLNSGWLCAGPYRQDGRQAQDLFDVAFPPERPGAPQPAWRRAPGSPDLSRRGEIDLSSITGGDHCVVYARTRLYAPEAGPALFAIGSDDGIKLWLNGDLLHANNAVRGLTPGEDRAHGRLRKGWNEVLAKITQHTAGCGLNLRVSDPEGRDLPGLRIDARGGDSR